MDVLPFINIGGTCPPCPIGIDAPGPETYCVCTIARIYQTTRGNSALTTQSMMHYELQSEAKKMAVQLTALPLQITSRNAFVYFCLQYGLAANNMTFAVHFRSLLQNAVANF